MSIEPTTDATRIAQLEDQVASLTAMVEQLMPKASVARAASGDEAATSTRRSMLRLAGATAVGAAAVAVAGNATPAAADNGSFMQIGQAGDGTVAALGVQQATSQTRFDWLPLSTGAGFLFQGGSANVNHDAEFPCALAGWTTSTPNAAGVYGRSTVANGSGVVGMATATLGGDTASAGVRGAFGQYSVAANRSVKANLYLQPDNNTGVAVPKTTPSARGDAHLVGEMENVAGDLWWCVVAGTPGTWRKLSGPGAAGAFHAVTPGRVYDSRTALPAPGVLAGGTNRTVSVADRRDTTTGAVLQSNFVPAGATAVAANVTVTQTLDSGFLTCNPGGVVTSGSSTINWLTPKVTIANGVILTLDASRQLTVVASARGGTHFLIDITGYFL